MPIISVCAGISRTSLLIYKSQADFKFVDFPYAYTQEIYGHGLSGSNFYQRIIESALEYSLTSEYDVLMSGFPDAMKVDFPVKQYTGLAKLISSSGMSNCLYVSNFTLIGSDGFVSAFPVPYLTEASKSAKLDSSDILNYYANLSIYPHISPQGMEELLNYDAIIRFLSLEFKPEIQADSPVIFSGDRFGKESKDENAEYLIMFDLIKAPGVFELKVDNGNTLPLVAMINSFGDKTLLSLSAEEFVRIGTLLNAPGGAECLFESEAGTSQLVDVKPDTLFLIPLREGSRGRIVVKNAQTGSFEKNIAGGKLGFIIDTRHKQNFDYFTLETNKKNTALWKSILEQAVVEF